MAGDNQTWKSPQESCNELLKTLRESNLHFIVSESPYSVQICVRKKFLNNIQEQKKAVSSSRSQSATKGVEKSSEDLAKETASLTVTLKEANKDIEDLKNKNEILVTRLENAEKELLQFCKEKTESTKKFDDTALQRAKVKSLEKSLKALEKKVNNAEKILSTAHDDTIANLETEITSKTKLNIKDDNENILESFSLEPETGSKQISCLPISPTRKGSLTRNTPCAPPSPRTPPGPPPSGSMSTELQPSATLSCYFPYSVADLVNESKPITGDYIKNLSKLNLAPRKLRQEDT